MIVDIIAAVETLTFYALFVSVKLIVSQSLRKLFCQRA